jgi:lysophospholipase II
VLNLVETEIKSGIPSEKILIGGFSQGGATALYTALTSSHRFGGIIALSTWLPLHHRFPADLKLIDNKLSTPIIQCHGDSDPMVQLEWSKKSAQLLKTLGFTNVEFKTYRGLSHSSSMEVKFTTYIHFNSLNQLYTNFS